MSGKRSNSSNERTDSGRSASKGRPSRGSRGLTGSKGSLLSKADAENDYGGEYEQPPTKFHPKELHQNTTLQLIKKGRNMLALFRYGL